MCVRLPPLGGAIEQDTDFTPISWLVNRSEGGTEEREREKSNENRAREWWAWWGWWWWRNVWTLLYFRTMTWSQSYKKQTRTKTEEPRQQAHKHIRRRRRNKQYQNNLKGPAGRLSDHTKEEVFAKFPETETEVVSFKKNVRTSGVNRMVHICVKLWLLVRCCALVLHPAARKKRRTRRNKVTK